MICFRDPACKQQSTKITAVQRFKYPIGGRDGEKNKLINQHKVKQHDAKTYLNPRLAESVNRGGSEGEACATTTLIGRVLKTVVQHLRMAHRWQRVFPQFPCTICVASQQFGFLAVALPVQGISSLNVEIFSDIHCVLIQPTLKTETTCDIGATLTKFVCF